MRKRTKTVRRTRSSVDPRMKAYAPVAGVCLLDNPFPIDGIYDYRIPKELEREVRVGAFVTVPFGTANRHRIALVRELREHSEFAELKSVISVETDTLALDGEMLGLCDFMKTRTLSSTGDAVRAMIPASALSKLILSYAPVKGADGGAEIAQREREIYEYLQGRGETALTALREKFGADTEACLRRLSAKGLVERRYTHKDASRGMTERRWSAAVPRETLTALASGEEHDGLRVSSVKQRAVLEAILSADEALTSPELRERAGVTDAPIKSLFDKGFLKCEEHRVERNPYAEAPYTGQTPLSLSDEQTAAAE